MSNMRRELTEDAPFEASLINLSPSASKYDTDCQTQQVEKKEFSQKAIEPEIEINAETLKLNSGKKMPEAYN